MAGFTLYELLVSTGLLLVLGAIAVPRLTDALDHWRARNAASFVASRVALTRMHALQRNAIVGIRFETDNGFIRMQSYQDGNGDGIRARDISDGIDVPVLPPERLDQLFPGVQFGFLDDGEMVDGTGAGAGTDPIRVGTARILSCTPDGTSTAGTLYLRGRKGWQYAVVTAGATGRTRVLQFEPRARRWTTP